MKPEEVKSPVPKKARKKGSIAVLRKKIESSRRDIENGNLIENKLLRKEVRIWLKNR